MLGVGARMWGVVQLVTGCRLAKPSRGIVPVPAPRMAACQPVHRQNEASNGTVLPECSDGVLRARRVEPTTPGHMGRNEKLIRPHNPDEEETGKPIQDREEAPHRMAVG